MFENIAFDTAMELLQNGTPVARRPWPKSVFLSDILCRLGQAQLVLRVGPRLTTNWMPTTDDIAARDWHSCAPPPKDKQ